MTPSEFEAEILRIERAHDQRKKTVPADCDSFSNLGNRCIEQEVQRSLLKLLGRCDGFDLQVLVFSTWVAAEANGSATSSVGGPSPAT
jgi:hypothetical protein